MALVTAKHIYVQMGRKTLLSDVHLTVRSQEIVTLIGPNGAGKTTLVKVILGLISPSSGEVQLQQGIRVGYMPQGLEIEPYMPISVYRFLKLTEGVPQEYLQRVIRELKIDHLQNAAVQSISGGELQRVLLARAMLRKPDLLVLDEPVQGVDVTGQEELYRLIAHIRDRHRCGILMVSHDLHLVMAGTDSVVCLNKHVCCSGHPEEVTQHPEFLNLFGAKTAEIAIYTHQHNHKHDLGGEICS